MYTPNEVESVAAEHPGVLEVAAVAAAGREFRAKWSRYS